MNIDDLSPIGKDSTGLKRLELQQNYERIINGLVKTHLSKGDQVASEENELNFDPVRAKGDNYSFQT